LEIRGFPGPFQIYISPALVSPSIVLPEWAGAWDLHPLTMQHLYSSFLDSQGIFSIPLIAPMTPEASGVAIYWQAINADGRTLPNRFYLGTSSLLSFF
jgi:hypothetical protein